MGRGWRVVASLLALGNLRSCNAGAVPAFLTQHSVLPAFARCVSAATGGAHCTASEKPWSTKVPDDSIRVFLVRHGAVDLTTPGMTFPKNCFYGGHNVPLSAYGEAEARAAAVMLADEKLDMVFASPLSRAAYGGERVAEKHGLKIVLDDRFKEVQRGRWLGKTREQINAEYAGDLDNFAKDPEWNEHGGETYRGLSVRVLSGLDAMLLAAREAKATKIALVSHMWVTKSIVSTPLSPFSEIVRACIHIRQCICTCVWCVYTCTHTQVHTHSAHPHVCVCVCAHVSVCELACVCARV